MLEFIHGLCPHFSATSGVSTMLDNFHKQDGTLIYHKLISNLSRFKLSPCPSIVFTVNLWKYLVFSNISITVTVSAGESSLQLGSKVLCLSLFHKLLFWVTSFVRSHHHHHHKRSKLPRNSGGKLQKKETKTIKEAREAREQREQREQRKQREQREKKRKKRRKNKEKMKKMFPRCPYDVIEIIIIERINGLSEN